MKQAIHIFQKDVRYLRYDIGIALIAAIAFGLTTNPVILPVTWWFLISRVIHSDALPDRRRFWKTRPYEWRSLLGAKLLFILTFVNTPFLLADTAIVHAAGFSTRQQWAGLLWTQVLVSAAVVLPMAALSAITSGLVERFSL